MGTFEKCFLCIIYSILITNHELSQSLTPPPPFVLGTRVSIVLSGLVTFMDSSDSLIFSSQIPGTIGPQDHCTAIIPFNEVAWYAKDL